MSDKFPKPNWIERRAIDVLELLGNDSTRRPIPGNEENVDHTANLRKLDPSKTIGVFVFAVTDHKTGMDVAGVNIARNNFIEDMRKSYGDNFIVVDIPTNWTADHKQLTKKHLNNFVDQFNKAFEGQKPAVHITMNHHQETYQDESIAEALSRLNGSHKRALILACGPDSSAYHNMKDFDYVVIPRPDGATLYPEIDYRVSPAYRYAIAMIKDEPSANAMREQLTTSWSAENLSGRARDWIANQVSGRELL